MTQTSPPQIPGFRWTLFYGPEQSETSADTQHCVFNLKKRSWKGGIQVVVELTQKESGRFPVHHRPLTTARTALHAAELAGRGATFPPSRP